MAVEKKHNFDKVYLKYLPKVRHFAYSYLNDYEIASEIAQDIFVTVWEKWEEIDHNREILGYLLVLTKNRCLNVIRRQGVTQKYRQFTSKQIEFQISYQALNDCNNEKLNEKEISKILALTINKMPEKVRSTFMMSRVDRLKQQDIANIQGIALRTVESRLKTALVILRRSLRDYLVLFL